ncbi:MAG: adenylate/guanylate cyclase domain-containing protein [Rhodospirillales bacterium]|nr:MAG: adenylate/guanylate cyclase domain-containing protein [Rhodospirillales bacterium]
MTGLPAPTGTGWTRRWRVRALNRRFGLDRLLALGLLALAVTVYVAEPRPVEILRVKVFDLFQDIRPRAVTVRPVTIVDIDEDSLATLGQWPWPRNLLADLVEALFAAGAVVVAFDVVFPEPDRVNPATLSGMLQGLDSETRRRLLSLPSNDAVLADAIRGRRVVLGRVAQPVAGQDDAGPPLQRTIAVRRTADAPHPAAAAVGAPGLIRNIAVIEAAGAGHGFVSLYPETDGLVRRVPAVFAHDGELFPSLALEMLRLAFDRPVTVVTLDQAGLRRVDVAPGFSIPTDGHGRIWPYFSRLDPEKYVPAAAVLAGVADPAMLQGKIAVIGTSAFGLHDIRPTPVERSMPGVEVHAQIIENAATGMFLSRPNYMAGAEISLLLAGGLLLIWLVPKLGAGWTLMLFLLVAGGAGATAWGLFSQHRILFDASYAILAMLLLYTFLTYSGYTKEQVSRQRVRTAFQYYLSPAMVERLADDPSRLALGGETRTLTILFCDVRGFTSLSESYKDDPTGLTSLINRLLTPLTAVVLRRGGTVDKYMGDCIMAFWNAPLDDPQHARNACLAALEMQAVMAPLNRQFAAAAEAAGRPYAPMSVGVGVNSGTVVVGNMGSDQRFDYTVLGDDVNLASRLEGQSKAYGVGVIVGENTCDLAPDLAMLELDRIRVKGRREVVRIYTVLGDEAVTAGNAFAILAAAHARLLRAYRTRQWTEARAALVACRELVDGFDIAGLYDVYDRRIQAYEISPPPSEWDGVFEAETK